MRLFRRAKPAPRYVVVRNRDGRGWCGPWHQGGHMFTVRRAQWWQFATPQAAANMVAAFDLYQATEVPSHFDLPQGEAWNRFMTVRHGIRIQEM